MVLHPCQNKPPIEDVLLIWLKFDRFGVLKTENQIYDEANPKNGSVLITGIFSRNLGLFFPSASSYLTPDLQRSGLDLRERFKPPKPTHVVGLEFVFLIEQGNSTGGPWAR